MQSTIASVVTHRSEFGCGPQARPTNRLTKSMARTFVVAIVILLSGPRAHDAWAQGLPILPVPSDMTPEQRDCLIEEGRIVPGSGPVAPYAPSPEALRAMSSPIPYTNDQRRKLNQLNPDMNLALEEGDFLRAARIASEIADIDRDATGSNDPRYAGTLVTQAGMLMSWGVELERAETLAREGIAIFTRNFGEDPIIEHAYLVHADVLEAQGKYASAEPLRRSLLQFVDVPGNPFAVMAMKALVDNLAGQGRLADARSLLARAAAIADRCLVPVDPMVVRLYSTLGALLAMSGDIDEGLRWTSKAVDLGAKPILDRGSMDVYVPGAPGGADWLVQELSAAALHTLYNDAAANAEANNFPAAFMRLDEAARIVSMPFISEAARDEIGKDISLRRAHFQLMQGDYEIAANSLAAADLFEDATGAPRPDVALLLALSHLGQGKSDEALKSISPLLQQAQQERQKQNVRMLEVDDAFVRRSNSLSLASLYLRAAFDATEEDAVARSRETRIAFEEVQFGDAVGAVKGILQGTARNSMKDEHLRRLVGELKSAQDQLRSLDRDMRDAAAIGPEGDQRRLELSRTRAMWETRRSGLETEIEVLAPSYFELLTSPALPLPEAQLLLGDDEVLLVLTPGDEALPVGHRRGFVFALTREESAWAEIAMEPGELLAEIGALHELLSGGKGRAPDTGQPSGIRGYPRARAFRLYEALFGNPEIATLALPKTRWTLAPQGVLLSAPYAALVTKDPGDDESGDNDAATLRATAWLGLERALSLTPSIAALKAQRRDGASHALGEKVTFFGVGDPAFDGMAGPSPSGIASADPDQEARGFFRDRQADVEKLRLLPRLPGTRGEVERLAAAFEAGPEAFVLDVDATETEIRIRDSDGRLREYDVIVFATHGLMAGDFSGTLAEPALALAPPLVASEFDDGLLTASEVANLTLNARWVILSACNTAAGDSPDAEGLSGLARAFFYAGARTLLVSQWPVDDEAAQLLTTRAVGLQRDAQKAGRQLSAPHAMRQAMQERVQDSARDGTALSYAHPKAWAPFLLVSGE